MKISIRALLYVAPVLLLAGTPLAQTPSQRINVGVDPDAPHTSAPVQLAAAGSSVYAVWMDDRNFWLTSGSTDLYFNRSLDGGATWMANDVQIDVAFAGDPSLSSGRVEIAAHGALVCSVWAEKVQAPYTQDFGVFANRSEDGGATWLTFNPRISEDLGQYVAGLDMAMVEDSVYVVWEDDRDGAPAIYCNRSPDGGLTWLPTDVRVATSSAHFPTYQAFDSAVRLAASGTTLGVVWEDDRNTEPGGERDIYFNRSLDGGLTWLPEDVRLDVGSPSSGDSRHPRIAMQGSTVYVVWDDDLFGERDVFFNRSLDGGATWLRRELRLDRGSPFGAADSVEPQVAATAAGVFVAWSDRRDGYGDVYFNRSLDGGTTWLTPDVRLDTGDEPGSVSSEEIRIATEGQALLVAWHDGKTITPTDPGYSRIGFNRSLDLGDTWLPAHVFVSDGDHAHGPAIATGASSLYLAWHDTRHPSGWGDVYFTMPVGHQPYGAGTPGTGGFVPTLTADGLPCMGGSFAFEVDHGLGGATVLIAYGLDGKDALPVAGGMLLVADPLLYASAVLGGTPGAAGEGTVSVPVPVPSDLAFLGLRVNAQAIVLDPAGSLHVALTGALETWIL